MWAERSGAVHNSGFKRQQKCPAVVTDVQIPASSRPLGPELARGICEDELHL